MNEAIPKKALHLYKRHNQIRNEQLAQTVRKQELMVREKEARRKWAQQRVEMVIRHVAMVTRDSSVLAVLRMHADAHGISMGFLHQESGLQKEDSKHGKESRNGKDQIEKSWNPSNDEAMLVQNGHGIIVEQIQRDLRLEKRYASMIKVNAKKSCVESGLAKEVLNGLLETDELIFQALQEGPVETSEFGMQTEVSFDYEMMNENLIDQCLLDHELDMREKKSSEREWNRRRLNPVSYYRNKIKSCCEKINSDMDVLRSQIESVKEETLAKKTQLEKEIHLTTVKLTRTKPNELNLKKKYNLKLQTIEANIKELEAQKLTKLEKIQQEIEKMIRKRDSMVAKIQREQEDRLFYMEYEKYMEAREAPSGNICFVRTEVQGLQDFWEKNRDVTVHAASLHDITVRKNIQQFNGHEVSFQSSCFSIAFDSIQQAMMFALKTQTDLSDRVRWPQELLQFPSAAHIVNKDGQSVYRGFRVRMSIACGNCEVKSESASNSRIYFGLPLYLSQKMLNYTGGGQITIDKSVLESLEKLKHDFGMISKEIGLYQVPDCDKELHLFGVFPNGLRDRDILFNMNNMEKELSKLQSKATLATSQRDKLSKRVDSLQKTLDEQREWIVEQKDILAKSKKHTHVIKQLEDELSLAKYALKREKDREQDGFHDFNRKILDLEEKLEHKTNICKFYKERLNRFETDYKTKALHATEDVKLLFHDIDECLCQLKNSHNDLEDKSRQHGLNLEQTVKQLSIIPLPFSILHPPQLIQILKHCRQQLMELSQIANIRESLHQSPSPILSKPVSPFVTPAGLTRRSTVQLPKVKRRSEHKVTKPPPRDPKILFRPRVYHQKVKRLSEKPQTLSPYLQRNQAKKILRRQSDSSLLFPRSYK